VETIDVRTLPSTRTTVKSFGTSFRTKLRSEGGIGEIENMSTNTFIRYRHPIYGGQLRPQLDLPKAEAQAANEPRTNESNEQSPPLDSPKAPQPTAEHSENTGAKLQAAIREIAAAREVNRISTRNVLEALIKRKGEPWAAWWERDIARGNVRGPAAKLARLLKPFGIIPETIREADGTTPKGYKLESFDDAFSRYLPSKPNATTPQGA
jgi:Protein of unknown function (DUF3631)